MLPRLRHPTFRQGKRAELAQVYRLRPRIAEIGRKLECRLVGLSGLERLTLSTKCVAQLGSEGAAETLYPVAGRELPGDIQSFAKPGNG
jgi:hypothetical protein